MNKLFNIIPLALCLSITSVKAQVTEGRMGVGTEVPTRTLHVEGDLQVKGLQTTSSGAYNRMLVSDNAGNIDFANIWTVTPTRKRVWHLQYKSTDGQYAINDSILKAGRFEFRYERLEGNVGHTGRIQFRLSEKPVSNVSVYLNHEENWDGDGFQYTARISTKDFTITDWNKWQYPVTDQQAQMAAGEMNEMFISYPGENAFYRLLIYRMQTATNESTWIITAEEFGT